MYLLVYFFVRMGNFFNGLAHELYNWLWRPATTFTVLILCYVLFEFISIVVEHLEREIDTSAVDTRLMIQGRLLSMEGRLKAIENKLDRIERALSR